MTSPPLERYAFPLLPPGEDSGTVIQLDRRWDLDPGALGDLAVCGRPPLRSVAQPAEAVTNAVRRDRFIRRCKRERAEQVRAVHLLPPPPGSSVPGLRALRDRLLSGALVLLAADPPPDSSLEVVARAAGAASSPASMHVPGDGGAVARIVTADGPRILRFAGTGAAADPAWVADGLERLERAGIGAVPRLGSRGEVAGLSWMTESVLAGSAPRRVDGGLWEQLIQFCARLPRANGPPTAPGDDLDVVARLLPDRAEVIEDIRTRVGTRLAALSGVLRHGDFWAGNFLTTGSGLTGVVDWAAWHPAAAPGADLVHLFAANRKKKARGQLGDMWSTRPWREPDFLRSTATYWRALDLDPTPDDLDAIALAWWASWVAQSLSRHPGRANQPAWVRGNVERVLGDLPWG